MKQPPLSLYIHIPWCIKKCPYCDFNSHQLRGEIQEQHYIEALIANFDQLTPYIFERSLQTIFIGGGTPSLFSASAYQTLFTQIQQRIAFADSIEITLEANPGTVDADYFAGYRETGINRLSLGVQSFQNDKLKKLGRIHNADEVYRAVEIAKKSGFSNFNIDLMFGLPNQTIDDALFDLRSAIELKPTHLSWYQLTLEPQTFFYKHPPKLPNDDLIWAMQEAGQTLLKEHGFMQYEISAYAKDNKPCRHNMNYWEFGDYLGIGAGAHGKVTDRVNQQIIRFENTKSPAKYMDCFVAHSAPRNDDSELAFEFMLNALRLQKPIPIELYETRTGCSLDLIKTPLEKAQQLALLTIENQHFVVSEKGQRYLNELLELFL